VEGVAVLPRHRCKFKPCPVQQNYPSRLAFAGQSLRFAEKTGSCGASDSAIGACRYAWQTALNMNGRESAVIWFKPVSPPILRKA